MRRNIRNNEAYLFDVEPPDLITPWETVHVIEYTAYENLRAERDEYVEEAERFQHKCIDLDQANGILRAELAQVRAECEKFRTMASLEHHLECHEKWRIERDELKAELSRERDLWHEMHNKETGLCAQLKAKLTIVLEALEFYADKSTWQAYGTQALEDSGERARAAIEKVKGK